MPTLLETTRPQFPALGRRHQGQPVAYFDGPGGTQVPVSVVEAMADYLGLTLETVSRQISALKRDGVIALEGNRRVTVPDFHRLALESGDDSDGGLPA